MKNKIILHFGEKLKELRELKNLTQTELANILNVNVKTIKNWESEKSYPRLETLINISQFFNVKVNYLLLISIYNENKI